MPQRRFPSRAAEETNARCCGPFGFTNRSTREQLPPDAARLATRGSPRDVGASILTPIKIIAHCLRVGTIKSPGERGDEHNKSAASAPMAQRVPPNAAGREEATPSATAAHPPRRDSRTGPDAQLPNSLLPEITIPYSGSNSATAIPCKIAQGILQKYQSKSVV
jgi:hypothetical protein